MRIGNLDVIENKLKTDKVWSKYLENVLNECELQGNVDVVWTCDSCGMADLSSYERTCPYCGQKRPFDY